MDLRLGNIDLTTKDLIVNSSVLLFSYNSLNIIPGRRSLLEPDVELIMVTATPKQTWGRSPLLRLVPAEGGAKPHYRISYGDDNKDFILSKRDGAWALRLRRHLKSETVFERQLELEARFVPVPEIGARRRRRHLDDMTPAPLKLYVSVRVAPPKR